jgi:hypothetical protein
MRKAWHRAQGDYRRRFRGYGDTAREQASVWAADDTESERDMTGYTSGFYWIKPSGRDDWVIARYRPGHFPWTFCGNDQTYATDELIRDGDTIGPRVDWPQ